MAKKQYDPWIKVPADEAVEYHSLAETIVPYIRQKPFDLWIFTGLVYYHVAILRDPKQRGPYIATARFSFFPYWKRPPSIQYIRKKRPTWSEGRVRQAYQGFLNHESWGPGDVENIVIDVKKDISECILPADLDSRDPNFFYVSRISYRTNATRSNFVNKFVTFQWDKLGGETVAYELPPPVSGKPRGFEFRDMHAVVTMGGYHHDGEEMEEVIRKLLIWRWPKVDKTKAVYFSPEKWIELCMHRDDLFLGFSKRDQQPWDRG